jgi:methylglutaconyl-CoA hydratase/polyketide biosynthesis enoyl-CoA hydratase PksH
MALRVLSDYGSSVAVVTLAAPDDDNALGAELVVQLRDALRGAAADPACRAIVLRARGPHFCRGVDLAAVVRDHRPDADLLCGIVDCFLAITRAPQPVIACVEGHATGGGVGLVAACDLVIAADTTTFTLPEVIVGMIPALVTPLLLRRMPPGRVRAMALATRAIPASMASDIGLVDAVVPESEIERALQEQLQRILRSSPRALAETKRYFDGFAPALEPSLHAALERLLGWLGDPAVVEGIGCFASGVAVPEWFQRYEVHRRV